MDNSKVRASRQERRKKVTIFIVLPIIFLGILIGFLLGISMKNADLRGVEGTVDQLIDQLNQLKADNIQMARTIAKAKDSLSCR
jgi:hypothetical protein